MAHAELQFQVSLELQESFAQNAVTNVPGGIPACRRGRFKKQEAITPNQCLTRVQSPEIKVKGEVRYS